MTTETETELLAGHVRPQRRIATHIGAECSEVGQCPTQVSTWLGAGTTTLGPLEANKQFYSNGQRMTTWSAGHRPTDQEARLPTSCLPLICFDTDHSADLVPYCRSIPPGKRVVLIPCQEAEGAGKWPNGVAFTDWFKQQSDAIRSVNNPYLLVAHDAASSAYNPGARAANGSYVPPDDFVDLRLVDVYQNMGNWPKLGLADYPRFQQWLHCVGTTKPIGIAEYGIDGSKGDPARNDRLIADAHFLLSGVIPHLFCFLYWWSDCTAAVFQTSQLRKHQFTDGPTISTFKSLIAGTFH